MVHEINFLNGTGWKRMEKKIPDYVTCRQLNYYLVKRVPLGGQDLVFKVESHYCGCQLDILNTGTALFIPFIVL